ncbi:MAG TPA: OB-fold domain-containing protein [Acidimicrobiia bacterium]|nr:OB-fold domain-containing protein [Acidimicrobiia bacterium]
MPAQPVADGLFTWPADQPQLIGSRCRACGVVTFPAQCSCPRCTSVDVEERLLGREGTLYTWTVQGFRPKPPYAGPEEFGPYGVGYVEIAGEVRVEARLTVADPDQLRIGMPVELVIVPFGDKVTYAFAPLEASAVERGRG